MRKHILTSFFHLLAWQFSTVTVAAVAFSLFELPRKILTGICLAVSKAAATVCKVGREAWKVVERMCTEAATQTLNMLGYHARSTGALCSGRSIEGSENPNKFFDETLSKLK